VPIAAEGDEGVVDALRCDHDPSAVRDRAAATTLSPSRSSTRATDERAMPNTATLPSAVGPTPLASLRSACPATSRCQPALSEHVSESLANARHARSLAASR